MSEVMSSIGLMKTRTFECGPFSDTCTLMLNMIWDPSEYAKLVRRFVRELRSCHFGPRYLEAHINNILTDVRLAKRDAGLVAKQLLQAQFYAANSNVRCCSMLRQQEILTTLLGQDQLCNRLNAIWANITQPKNISIHVAANWHELSKTIENKTNWFIRPWAQLADDQLLQTKQLVARFDYSMFRTYDQTKRPMQNRRHQRQLKTMFTRDWLVGSSKRPTCRNPKKRHHHHRCRHHSLTSTTRPTGVIVHHAFDASYLHHAAPSIRSYSDPDLPALMLIAEYMSHMNGPLYDQIRDHGFAYHSALWLQVSEGLLHFAVHAAANVFGAFELAQRVIRQHADGGGAVWDETLLASVKGAMLYDLVKDIDDDNDLLYQAMLGRFGGEQSDRDLVERVTRVTVAELQRVFKRWVAPLFGVYSRTSIVCAPGQESAIAKQFAT